MKKYKLWFNTETKKYVYLLEDETPVDRHYEDVTGSQFHARKAWESGVDQP